MRDRVPVLVDVFAADGVCVGVRVAVVVRDGDTVDVGDRDGAAPDADGGNDGLAVADAVVVPAALLLGVAAALPLPVGVSAAVDDGVTTGVCDLSAERELVRVSAALAVTDTLAVRLPLGDADADDDGDLVAVAAAVTDADADTLPVGVFVRLGVDDRVVERVADDVTGGVGAAVALALDVCVGAGDDVGVGVTGTPYRVMASKLSWPPVVVYAPPFCSTYVVVPGWKTSTICRQNAALPPAAGAVMPVSPEYSHTPFAAFEPPV